MIKDILGLYCALGQLLPRGVDFLDLPTCLIPGIAPYLLLEIRSNSPAPALADGTGCVGASASPI